MSDDKLLLQEVEDAAIEDEQNNQAGLHSVRELEVVRLTAYHRLITWDFASLTRLTVSHTRPRAVSSFWAAPHRAIIELRLPNLVSLGMSMTWVSRLDVGQCPNLETLALNDFYSSQAVTAWVHASECARLRELDLEECWGAVGLDLDLPDDLRLERLTMHTHGRVGVYSHGMTARVLRCVSRRRDESLHSLPWIRAEHLVVRAIGRGPATLSIPPGALGGALVTLTIAQPRWFRGFRAIDCSGCPALTEITLCRDGDPWRQIAVVDDPDIKLHPVAPRPTIRRNARVARCTPEFDWREPQQRVSLVDL